MTLYSNVTTPELIQRVLKDPHQVHPAHRIALIRILAERLKREYQRAERHLAKSVEAASTIYQQASQLDRLQFQPTPPQGYIKVAKPHIQLVSSASRWPTSTRETDMWRCTGSDFSTVQYGDSPSKAYAAWRRVMEHGHGIPR